MARPRVSSKPRKSRGSENLTSLSEEVLRLRLHALNLSITDSKAVLVRRLKAATHPRKGITSWPSKTQAVVRANTSTRSTRRATSAHHERRNLRPFKPLMLFYWVRTPRKSRWRPTPTWMILWWRTSRRQRLTQGIPLPLLSSPPLRARCNPLRIARFRVFPSPRISFHGRHISLQWHTVSASRNSISSGLAPSVRKEFGRQNPTE